MGRTSQGGKGRAVSGPFAGWGWSRQAGLQEKVTTTGDMLCWRLAGRGVGFVLGPEKLSSPEGSAGRQDGCRWPGRLGEHPVPENAWLPTLCVLAAALRGGLDHGGSAQGGLPEARALPAGRAAVSHGC